jgi:hypothetical protein
MFMTLHVKDKPVKVGLRRIEHYSSVSEFFNRPFEITVEAEDKSFCLVGFLSPSELETLGESVKQELLDYDFGKDSNDGY